jgi:hypothetical protein
VKRVLLAAVCLLLLAGAAGGATVGGRTRVEVRAGERPRRAAATVPAAGRTPTTTTVPLSTTTTSSTTQPVTAALAGCPVPSGTPQPAQPPPWHPSVLVPDSALPPVTAPAPWHPDLAAVTGKGMWIWEWPDTDGGNAAAVVAQAVRAGLHQLWVRVGDSKDGFYGAGELDALVPAAHAAGLSVIAWGFPYLYDPVGDARWTAQILSWRDRAGQGVDGYSADLEEPTEGVDMTARRAAVYLELVRRQAGNLPVVATVYPPGTSGYPYSAMAPYVDAFAPMIYWECTDPRADVLADVARLALLRPVDVIGQAFNLAGDGGRAVSPSGAEIDEFLSAAVRAGAIGASFWVWQSATPQEWAALSSFDWP